MAASEPMISRELAERVGEMLDAFPELVEIYPLDRFLDAFLAAAERIASASPVGCLLARDRRLAVRRDGAFRVETVDEETASAVAAAGEAGAIVPSRLGRGAAARALADLPELRLVPCRILCRPVGYLLLSPGTGEDRRLALLGQLGGYYLHRNEIEREIERLGGPWVIMGCSPWIFQAQEDLERFSMLREPVLITGESGSGKEVFAQAVHVLSARRVGPFVSVNCAAAPSENLLLDDFFGHRRGAFSGAVLDKEGCCQEANGGTLFLDEIGEMSHELQTLLLRTIVSGEVRRLGDARTTRVDLRLISATHRDLLTASQERGFRADLYYRISAFQLHIPPLRERIADIRYLAEFTLHNFARANGLSSKRLTEAAWRKLEAHPWPGNVRELENVLKRAFVMAPGDVIDGEDLHLDHAQWVPASPAERLFYEMRQMGRSFWDAVYRPFIRRDLTRADVALLLDRGLRQSGGRLNRLASHFNVAPEEYGRFVAFLHRHGFRSREAASEDDEGAPRAGWE